MFYLLIFILGLIFGSFINVIILRLHSREKITGSRSHCPHCKHQLQADDLVPLFSFLLRRGRCKYCRAKISWQYPLVELATALLFLLAFVVETNRFGLVGDLYLLEELLPNWQFWLTLVRDWFFSVVLVIVFVYDLKWRQILDSVTIPAMVVAGGFNLLLNYRWYSLLLAAVFGLLFFGIQFVISREWIGDGDLRLGFLMGLMLGWPNIIVGIFLAYIIGAVFSIFLIIVKGKKLKSQIAFGTFLSLSTLVALYWGTDIINWYLGLL